MPTYEYRCPHCGHHFDVMHAVNAKPPKCERCGRAVRRVFTPVGIIFKGSGWHITDYRKTPAPSDGETKGSDKSSSDVAAGDGGKTAAKSADKTPSSVGKSGGSAKSTSRSGGGGDAS